MAEPKSEPESEPCVLQPPDVNCEYVPEASAIARPQSAATRGVSVAAPAFTVSAYLSATAPRSRLLSTLCARLAGAKKRSAISAPRESTARKGGKELKRYQSRRTYVFLFWG